MNWNRIKALMYRYLMYMRRDLARLLDTFYWPIIDIMIWGFLTMYINQTQTLQNKFTTTLLAAIIMWTLVYSVARDVAVSFLDDMWDRDIINLYCSPLKPSEFLVASFLIAVLRVSLTTIVIALLAWIFYSFNLMILSFYFFLFFILLVLFSYSIGILATTLIVRFGQSVEIFAWSIPAVISPFSAVFYPLSVLPLFMQ